MTHLVSSVFVLLAMVTAVHAEVTTNERCLRGGYVDSAESCRVLARETVGRDSLAANELMLRAARYDLWACKTKPETPACTDAVSLLFETSPHPEDVTQVVAMSQRTCHERGLRHACWIASVAAWYGRGVPADGAASAGWFGRCVGCPDTFDPDGPLRVLTVPWVAAVDDSARAARLREMIAARHFGRASQLSKPWPSHAQVLIEIAEAEWALDVEPLRAAGQLLEALRFAQELEHAAPSLRAKTDELRRTIAAPQIALMQQARAQKLPLATRYHALRAAMFDKSIVVPPEQPVDWSSLPTRIAVTVNGESCDFLRSSLALKYPAAGANVQATATVTCTQSSTSSKKVERTLVSTEKVSRENTRLVPGGCRTVAAICNSMNSFEGRQCTETVCDSKLERYTVTTDVPRYESRTVTLYDTHITMQGTLASSFGTVTLAVDRRGDFDLDTATAHAISAVNKEIARWVGPVRDRAIEKELELAKRATGVVAEEHVLRAMSLGAYKAELLVPGSGLSESEIQSVLSTGTFSLPMGRRAIRGLFAPTLAALAPFGPEPTLPAATEVRKRDDGPKGPSWLRVPRRIQLAANLVARKDRDENWTTGFAARLEVMPRIDRSFDIALAASLGGGTEGEHGAFLDGRVALGTGVRSGRWQLIGAVGAGVTSVAVAEGRETGGEAGFGGDLAYRGEPGFGLHARYWLLFAGPLGDEKRIGFDLEWQRRTGTVIGIDLWHRRFAEREETLIGAGLFLRGR